MHFDLQKQRSIIKYRKGDSMGKVYDKVMEYKRKYPSGITWFRLKKHADVVEKHLNPGEEVLYAFTGQKNESPLDFFETAVIALTNKRILIGQKRVTPGYWLNSITPDLFNDMQVSSGILFGRITIDTVKEKVHISNLDKRGLPEIETVISEFMIEEKKKYMRRDENDSK